MTDKKVPEENVKELFEAIWSWYNTTEEKFLAFRHSDIGKGYKAALDDFVHDAIGNANSVKYTLNKGTLPESGRPSPRWKSYNKTYTSLRLMELILELWNNAK